ncbi:hypothetical protein N311_04229 [Apaloderma vittatum]|uniref:Uncharacterized protein n=1 Tax=Apaloderma vittatum TaxID=57397 RepID=A0A091PH98_APAVI|nr:hypothetical protein N311_04229 [Apaloderma vittatum]
MSAPAPQRAAKSLSLPPKRTLSHTSRAIKYIFLDGCKNVTASHILDDAGTHKVCKGSVSCQPQIKHSPSTAAGSCPPLPKYLPTFSTFPTHLDSLGRFLAPEKRLPVFWQLCGEAMPGVALGDVHLQNSSQELKKLPVVKEPSEDTKGWRMRRAAGCFPRDKA